MRPGLAALAEWDPAALITTADSVVDLRAALERAASDTEQSAAWTRRGWDSPGADAAFARIVSAQAAVTFRATLCSDLENALRTGSADIGTARQDALEAARIARGEEFEVADDGLVTPSAAQLRDAATSAEATDAVADRAELERRAQEHTTAIQTALRAVDAADVAAKTAIDSACSRMYDAPQVPDGVIATGIGPAAPGGASGPGWEFDPSIDPRTMAASTVIGGVTEATRIGAAEALKQADDPVLRKMFGGMDHLVSSPFAKSVWKGVSRAGAAGAVAGAVPSIHSNIESGMDTTTAVTSEVAGAGAGLFAGAASAALVGAAIGGPVGLVGGFVAGAVFGGAASHGMSKGIQRFSNWLQSD